MSKTVMLIVCAIILALPTMLCAEEKTKAKAAETKTTTSIDIAPKKQPQKNPINEMLKSRKVSFYFNETPITKAVSFLADLTEINFIVDIPEENEPKVTLRVKKMTLENALHWLCRLAKLKYHVVKGAIYVGDRDPETKYLKVYNIKDLLHPVKDFPGPQIKLHSEGDDEGFKLDGAGNVEDRGIDPQVIVDTIKEITKEAPIEE